MRDYSNMPILAWDGNVSAKKAMAQIHHEEPIRLQMPEGFIMSIDAIACDCEAGDKTGSYINCPAGKLLTALADLNKTPELAELAKVAHEAGQIVDLDTDTLCLIIHD